MSAVYSNPAQHSYRPVPPKDAGYRMFDGVKRGRYRKEWQVSDEGSSVYGTPRTKVELKHAAAKALRGMGAGVHRASDNNTVLKQENSVLSVSPIRADTYAGNTSEWSVLNVPKSTGVVRPVPIADPYHSLKVKIETLWEAVGTPEHQRERIRQTNFIHERPEDYHILNVHVAKLVKQKQIITSIGGAIEVRQHCVASLQSLAARYKVWGLSLDTEKTYGGVRSKQHLRSAQSFELLRVELKEIVSNLREATLSIVQHVGQWLHESNKRCFRYKGANILLQITYDVDEQVFRRQPLVYLLGLEPRYNPFLITSLWVYKPHPLKHTGTFSTVTPSHFSKLHPLESAANQSPIDVPVQCYGEYKVATTFIKKELERVVITAQRYIRRFLKIRKRIVSKRALKRLQSTGRACSARCQMRRLHRIAAATKIQSAFRGHRARKTVAMMHHCAGIIKAGWKGHGERRYLRWLKRATYVIQCFVRRKLRVKRKAALLLQAAGRGFLSRRTLCFDSHMKAHLCVVQKLGKGLIVRQQCCKQRALSAASRLRCAAAGYFTRRGLYSLLVRKKAATTISSVSKSAVVRMSLNREHVTRGHASRTIRNAIEALSRQQNIKRHIHRRRTKRHAAASIQQWYKGLKYRQLERVFLISRKELIDQSAFIRDALKVKMLAQYEHLGHLPEFNALLHRIQTWGESMNNIYKPASETARAPVVDELLSCTTIPSELEDFDSPKLQGVLSEPEIDKTLQGVIETLDEATSSPEIKKQSIQHDAKPAPGTQITETPTRLNQAEHIKVAPCATVPVQTEHISAMQTSKQTQSPHTPKPLKPNYTERQPQLLPVNGAATSTPQKVSDTVPSSHTVLLEQESKLVTSKEPQVALIPVTVDALPLPQGSGSIWKHQRLLTPADNAPQLVPVSQVEVVQKPPSSLFQIDSQTLHVTPPVGTPSPQLVSALNSEAPQLFPVEFQVAETPGHGQGHQRPILTPTPQLVPRHARGRSAIQLVPVAKDSTPSPSPSHAQELARSHCAPQLVPVKVSAPARSDSTVTQAPTPVSLNVSAPPSPSEGRHSPNTTAPTRTNIPSEKARPAEQASLSPVQSIQEQLKHVADISAVSVTSKLKSLKCKKPVASTPPLVSVELHATTLTTATIASPQVPVFAVSREAGTQVETKGHVSQGSSSGGFTAAAKWLIATTMIQTASRNFLIKSRTQRGQAAAVIQRSYRRGRGARGKPRDSLDASCEPFKTANGDTVYVGLDEMRGFVQLQRRFRERGQETITAEVLLGVEEASALKIQCAYKEHRAAIHSKAARMAACAASIVTTLRACWRSTTAWALLDRSNQQQLSIFFWMWSGLPTVLSANKAAVSAACCVAAVSLRRASAKYHALLLLMLARSQERVLRSAFVRLIGYQEQSMFRSDAAKSIQRHIRAFLGRKKTSLKRCFRKWRVGIEYRKAMRLNAARSIYGIWKMKCERRKDRLAWEEACVLTAPKWWLDGVGVGKKISTKRVEVDGATMRAMSLYRNRVGGQAVEDGAAKCIQSLVKVSVRRKRKTAAAIASAVASALVIVCRMQQRSGMAGTLQLAMSRVLAARYWVRLARFASTKTRVSRPRYVTSLPPAMITLSSPTVPKLVCRPPHTPAITIQPPSPRAPLPGTRVVSRNHLLPYN